MSASASTAYLTAYLLVSHGSHDPRPSQGMERLAHFVRSHDAWLRVAHPGSGNRSDSRVTRSRPSVPSPGPGSGTGTGTGKSLGGTAASTWPTDTPSQARPKSGILRPRVSPPEPVGGPLVGTACLELGAVPLHQQIVAFSRRARAAGAQRVRLVPLFLLAGVHVMEDIPAEIEQARQGLPDLTLEVCPHLGSHPGMKGLLHHKLRAAATEMPVLLSHGSRRPGGNEPICALARSLGGTAAFWAVAPSLESQVIHHMQSGVQRMAILPYFLFAGSTTDAITHLTEELAERFPQMGLHLLPPLGPTPELAQLVVDLALDQVPPQAQQMAIPMQRLAFRHTLHPSPMVS